ncbi:MAG: SUMF1/EgtB/PvdO family nonheme iron enzyme [Proteobacteria bacterium]|nr:SUMF1/EgtB/PvdO family nonheme iron enzyme [Pseudomonadota bacterium]
MSMLFRQLQQLQQETIDLVNRISSTEFNQQFHPDLSPVGWHLGHCVYTETYWIRERVLEKTGLEQSIKDLYVPELSNKRSRGSALPEKEELIEWAKNTQQENRTLLLSAIKVNSNPLMQEDYLLYFLIQHYSQHIETMLMVLTERNIKRYKDRDDSNSFTPIKDNKLSPVKEYVDAGHYEVGTDNILLPYDNEHPALNIELDKFAINANPVSNSEYLSFIYTGGYDKQEFWSDSGWQWRQDSNAEHPHHWQRSNFSEWQGIDHNGPYKLDSAQPVHGINHYEATAFANWSGARLPHEYEWEVAYKNQILKKTANAWEWCCNTFHPYPGFSAFPYDGYSTPYFDDEHYVLRGGSYNTKSFIKRPSFRNYYQPDKRHIFAGLRLVFN